MGIKQFGDLIDQRARSYAEINNCDYQTAFHAVLNDNPSLKAAYTGVATGKTSPEPSPKVSAYTQREIGDKVHELVVEAMEQSEHLCSYSQALQHVLREHPTLARAYAGE